MSRIRNLKTWVKFAIIGVLLVPIGLLVWFYLVKPQFWCGSGFDVRRIEEQCIGVTDGEVVLRWDLRDVLEKIRQENDRVEQDRNSVSVAYLVPLPRKTSDDERLLHELQGAHIAQVAMNHQNDRPRIRLLVANSGDRSSHKDLVVPDLQDRAKGPDRVVTVVATGDTLDPTLGAIRDLRSGGLPVVLSRLSGDTLRDPEQDKPLGGLARLAPSGQDQGAAAAAYLRKTASTTLIVRDENPDDPYLKAFYETFEKAFSDEEGTHRILKEDLTYDSRLDLVANGMNGIVSDICTTQEEPDVVLFAGRAPAMDDFVEALARRRCHQPITIMAPDGSVALAGKIASGDRELTESLRTDLESGLSFLYTAQTHRRSWTVAREFFSRETTDRLTSKCANEYCRGEELADGGVVIGYDAILTAATAIRPDHQQANDIGVTPGQVSQALKRLHGDRAIPGAAGWISLDDQGNPVNKAVVILAVRKNGSAEFLEVSSPSPQGRPCVPGEASC